MASLCNFPTLGIPNFSIDILALLFALLESLIPGFPPPLPTIPWPPIPPFCPLDELP